jgi:hypothetical protein
MRAAAVRRSESESSCGAAAGWGVGRLDRAGAKTARKARSAAARAESRVRPDSISKVAIIGV